MSDEERAAFQTASESGIDAGERARYWAQQGNREQAEKYLLQAAREIEAALQAVGSTYHIVIDPEPEG